ncbi:hypothetical protein C8R43DRAFT_1116632 [Mycena crocata]|nr:hypothetical protein C8R43DRAFT_1116632 [Mycena crocata]
MQRGSRVVSSASMCGAHEDNHDTSTSERHNTSDMEAEARHQNLIFERPAIFIAALSFHHLDVQNFRLIDSNVQHQSLRFPQDNMTFAATTRLICKRTLPSKIRFLGVPQTPLQHRLPIFKCANSNLFDFFSARGAWFHARGSASNPLLGSKIPKFPATAQCLITWHQIFKIFQPEGNTAPTLKASVSSPKTTPNGLLIDENEHVVAITNP